MSNERRGSQRFEKDVKSVNWSGIRKKRERECLGKLEKASKKEMEKRKRGS